MSHHREINIKQAFCFYQVRPLGSCNKKECRAIWEIATKLAENTTKDITVSIVKAAKDEFFKRRTRIERPPHQKLVVFLSSKNSAWYTPVHILRLVDELYDGEIDLDPCSDLVAQERVKAKAFYSKEDDGLNPSNKWRGKIFMNPPFGGEGCISLQGLFVKRAIDEFENNPDVECILMFLKASIGYQWLIPIWKYPVCFVEGKVRFDNKEGTGAQNPHGSIVVFLGRGAMVDKFCKVFSQIGYIPGYNSWCYQQPTRTTSV